jgi:hypothetical protein
VHAEELVDTLEGGPATRGVNEGIERSASLLRIVRRQELLDCLPMLVARRFDAA